MGRRMTVIQVQQAIRQLGMTCGYNPSTREYRVNFPKAVEDTAYYTNDAEDAIDTAKAMLAFASQPAVNRGL